MMLLLAGRLPAEVVISEIMYHQSSEKVTEEFIELHNTGAVGQDVSGWAFTSGVTFTFPPATTIPPGGRLVVAAHAADFTAKYPAVGNYIAGWTGRLSNSSNKIVLADALGAKIDEVDYSDDGDWALRAKDTVADYGHYGWDWTSAADGGGSSLELIQAGFDNSTGQNWQASTAAQGTPGAANSVAAADIAPVIRDVSHFPLVPKSTEPVFVTARIDDDGGTPVTAAVHWRVDGGGAFSFETMADDGSHGDTLAGDGIFGASLPVQAAGTVVEFYISAADAATNQRTWPAPALGTTGVPGQTANCLYQVDNTTYSGAMPIYQMIVRAADKAELTQINTNSPVIAGVTDQSFSEAQVNATFIARDGTGSALRYRCGLRNRGASSRSFQPQSYRINFLEEQPWDGVAGLNLNTQNTQCQLLGSAVYRKAGATMAMARAVQVRVNSTNPASATGSPAYGFYVANEVLDSNYAENHYPLDSGGNLYRALQIIYSATVPGGDLGDWSDHPDPALADPAPYRVHYFKRTNQSEDDWSDLIGLTQKLAKGRSPSLNAPNWDADYAAAVRSAADVGQWMRFFAVQTIADNTETNLSNGRGDDYSMYFGATDKRCRLIPYDLDSVFGRSSGSAFDHSLWLMCQNPSMTGSPPTPVNAFMKHPEFAPLYFAELKRMIDGPLSPAQFDPLADEVLGGLVDVSVITPLKTFNAQRTTWIAGQIPDKISVLTFPAVVSGYPKSTTATTTLGGKANAVTTRSVKVNGVAATWTAWTATWSATGVALKPGINRVLIQAFDGAGAETERLHYDVWHDDSSLAPVAANITANTTWTAAGGPWSVTAAVSVASGATLTIEPGASVYFTAAGSLTIASGGRLLAEGTDTSRIRFTVAPGGGATWPGLVINGGAGSPESRISYARIDANTGPAIDVNAGDVVLDHLQFGNTAAQYLSLDGASFLVSHCDFPKPTAAFEPVHGTLGVKAGGRGIFRHCWFGAPNGYNDAFDFTGGQRPAPILQLIDNVFTGSGDDLVDLDGTDAWIEGNIFLHCHKNGAPDSAAAVSGGNDGAETSQITITGNLFYDVDHAVTAKQGNYYSFTNNTVLHQTKSGGTDVEAAVFALQDAIPLPATTYGAGLYAEANILADCGQLVRNYSAADSMVSFNNNLIDLPWSGPGAGNTSAEPLFQYVPTMAETTFTTWSAAQVMKQWLSLRSGSPARGTGPNGRDKGGAIARGVCLSANIPAVTNLTAATVTVGPQPSAVPTWPSGHTHYRWRLDGGAWSAETPVATPVSLTGLAAGAHTIEVAGKSDALFWQDDSVFGPAANVASFTWTVNPAHVPPGAAPLVRINEVLAKNSEALAIGGVYPDLIELHNAGNATANLEGWGLTDDASVPYKYYIPAGTTLAAGAYLLIPASSSVAVPLPKTGFGLKDQGDTLTLTKSIADGGGVADSVAFGNQVPDYSIGRRSADGAWDLCRPTFGTANVIATQGDPRVLRINEWLAISGALSPTDFIELFNPGMLPVNIGGGFLTDNPVEWPGRHAIRQLTYVGASGYALFKADGDTNQGPDHLSFRLSASQGEIGLFASDLSLIDSVVYGPQSTDVSQGRSPNGGSAITFFTQPSPGGPNPGTTVTSGTTTLNLIPVNATWKYSSSATDYSGTFHTVAFNDTAWPSGAQLLHVETATSLPSASGFVMTTPLPKNGTLPFLTTYFRRHFNWSGATSGVVLRGTAMMDDGAVIYLNGTEVLRVRMPSSGAIGFNTLTTGTATGANTDAGEETIYLPAASLVEGDNVIAVEVHQTTTNSSDVVWGLKLDADITSTVPSSQVVINEVLVNNATLANPDTSLSAWVELYNPSATDADISDMSLGTSAASPRAWIAPENTVIPAGGYLVVQCDPALPASVSNTGFGLNATGGGLHLFLAPAIGGGLRDSVTWGNQLADHSIGRSPSGSGAFALNLPSRAAINTTAATGPLTGVKINEWLATPSAGADWFEVYNAGTSPVLLGGNYLTDSLTNKTKHLIAPFTFIGAGGWLQFVADNNASVPGHVNFALSGTGEQLGVYTSSGVALDALAFGAQTAGVSQGRYPDGNTSVLAMLPTPAALNTLPDPDSDNDGMPDSWENANGLAAGSSADANLDADHDGMSNLREYLAGTDPQDASSRFTNAITRDGGVPTLRFLARAGRSYTVQYSNALGSWAKLADITPLSVTAEVAVADPTAVGQTQRFYRILTPAQP